MAASVLLLAGYLREIENLLLTQQVIPDSISTLCHRFYYVANMLLHLSDQQSMFRVADIGSKHQWQCHIHPLKTTQSPSYTPYASASIHVNGGGLCYARSITLHPRLTKLIHETYDDLVQQGNDKTSAHEFDVIFQCGGHTTTQCNAFVIEHNSVPTQLAQKDLIAVKLALPAIECESKASWWSMLNCLNVPNLYGNNVVYSKHYGLFTIGGNANNKVLSAMKKLDFNGFESGFHSDWIDCKQMKQERFMASSVLIPCKMNDDGGKEKLFVAAGWSKADLTCGEVYDFQRDEWRNIAHCNHARYEAGIQYDEIRECVYLGGGYSWKEGVIQSVEQYDLHKNQWFVDLPQTTLKHRHIPLIWIEHQNLLSITSIVADGIEFIDLRCHQKKWSLIKDEKLMKQLFGGDMTNKRNFDDFQRRLLH